MDFVLAKLGLVKAFNESLQPYFCADKDSLFRTILNGTGRGETDWRHCVGERPAS